MMNSPSLYPPLPHSSEAKGLAIQNGVTAGELMLKCRQVKNQEDLEKIFPSLFEIISTMTWDQFKWDFLEGCLPDLLTHASAVHRCQLYTHIALRFSERGDREKSLSKSDQLIFSLEAMHYFAKAMVDAQLCKDYDLTKIIHKSASGMFMTFVMQEFLLLDAFKKSLIEFTKYEDPNAFEVFETLIQRINLLNNFCCDEKDHDLICTLYKQALDMIANIQPDLKEKYSPCEQSLIKGYQKPFILPQKYVTERYREALYTFRKSFEFVSKDKVRDLQFNKSKAFIEIFERFIEDAFAILGPPPATLSYQRKSMKYEYTPPCTYDIRAMGSLGRDEGGPYSKFDLIILVKDKKAISYFETLALLLKVQFASLGEPSLFNVRAILTPDMMAQLQNFTVNDPQAIENRVLSTKSIFTNDTALFESYQMALDRILKNCRKERAFHLCTMGCESYKKKWPKPFNSKIDVVDVKKQFIQPIQDFLNAIALYYNIPETNPLDILEAPPIRKLFDEESYFLLKECISKLYTIKIALQTYYEAPREEASCQDRPSFATLTFNEIQTLETCYLLVIRPLYLMLERSLKNPSEDFEKNFHNVDLIREAISSDLSKPLILQVMTYFFQINASIEVHLEIYQLILAQTTDDSYLHHFMKILEDKLNDRSLLEKFLFTPNKAGMYLAYYQQHKKLKDAVFAITEIFSTQQPGKQEVMVTVSGSLKPRFLRPALIQGLFVGKDIRSIYKSAHSVGHLKTVDYNLHFKQKPSQPLMEYAIHNLTARISGNPPPPSILVRLTTMGKSYPVLISQTAAGGNLKECWKDAQVTPHFTWNLLCEVLTLPGDGKLDNYILQDNGEIVCVDNDSSFVEPINYGVVYNRVQFACSLFSLFSLERELDQEVLEAFASLNVYSILKGWIDDVIQKEKEYKALFNEKERADLYSGDKDRTFTCSLLLKEGAISTLYLQFYYLQNLIRQKKIVNIGDLLKGLITLNHKFVGDEVYLAYKRPNTHPDETVKVATSRKQDRSMTSIQYQEASFDKSVSFEEIEVLRCYSAEKGRDELLALFPDGFNETHLKVDFSYFKNDLSREMAVLTFLSKMVKLGSKKPPSIVFKNSHLLTQKLLEPFLHEGLKSLHIEGGGGISHGTLTLISLKCPQLKTLVIIGWSKLTKIEPTIFVDPLKFHHLRHLEISHCDNLQTFHLEVPVLQTLQVENNPKLQHLELKSYLTKIKTTNSPHVRIVHHQEAFGKVMWEIYYGEIGPEPQLPGDIHEILDQPCPFWPKKKVRETHILVLIPVRVREQFLNMGHLGSIVQSPLHGFPSKYAKFNVSSYEYNPVGQSYWVLIPLGDEEISHDPQPRPHLVYLRQPGYTQPHFLEVAVGMFVMHVRGRKPPNFLIKCKNNGGQTCYVGNFTTMDGLEINVKGSHRFPAHGIKRFYPSGAPFPKSFPDELMVKIFAFLDVSSLAAAAHVSHQWNRIIQNQVSTALRVAVRNFSPNAT